MGEGVFAKLRRAVGLKNLDERIGTVAEQVAGEDAWKRQRFYYERDLFSHDLEELQGSDEAYTLGWYTNVLNERLAANVVPEDFRVHTYVLGGTGAGKSCFLEHLLGQHIRRGDGAALIDCHGDLYTKLCRWVAARAATMPEDARERYLRERVVLVDLTDEDRAVGLNPLAPLPGMGSDRQANQLLLIFRRFYGSNWGVKIEELARFSFMALIEAEGSLLDLEPLLVDAGFRAHVLQQVTTPEVRRYFATQLEQDRTFIPSILNKLRPLLLDTQLQCVLGQATSTLNFRDILDGQKIMLVNLSKSYLSANADLMGAFFVGMLQAAILSRRDMPPDARTPFFLYVDEFQNYANEQLEEILTESRKYGLFLTMAHQTLSQLPKDLQDVIRGNTDMQCFFRISPPDARTLIPGNFAATGRMERPTLTPYDTVTHPREQLYTAGEELAQYGEILANQPNRHLYYCLKNKPYKAQPLVTQDLPALAAELGMSAAELDTQTQASVLRSKAAYTRDKKTVQTEIAQRREDLEENPPTKEPRHPKRTSASEKVANIIPDIGDFKDTGQKKQAPPEKKNTKPTKRGKR